MKELSLHILDIVKNSVSAGAAHIGLNLTQTEDGTLTIVISDDGRGMSPEFLAAATDPFTTTRTTRKMGLGLPLYRLAAEQTGGSLTVESTVGKGTTVTAVFHTDHLDCAPMGDFAGTAALLIQGSPDVEWAVFHSTPKGSYDFSTAEIREILGEDVPLNAPEVFAWMSEYLAEQEEGIS